MESAAERKARLKALRAAAEEDGVVPARAAEDECAPRVPQSRRFAHAFVTDARCPARRPPLKFRNYVPKDQELREAKARARAGEHTHAVLHHRSAERLTLQISEAHAPEPEEPAVEAAAEEEEDVGEVLLSVQPKKANWDLRRDVAKKLEKLDKRTQRAMIELMRQEEERRTAEAAAGQ